VVCGACRFEAFQTGLPMCYLSGAVGPLALPSAERLGVFRDYLPWARKCGQEATFVLNVYYEKRFEEDLDELRRELNITLPPGAT
jgi:ubiquinone biosynthesis protein COQ4